MLKWYKFTCFLFVFLLVKAGSTQIVIDVSEYNIDLGAEHNVYIVSDSTGFGFSVDVGTTGGSQAWTFNTSEYPQGISSSYTVLLPSTTPFAADFPASDHVWYDASQSDTMAIYQYFNKENDGLYFDGIAMTQGDSQRVYLNDPPEKLLPFPAAMGSAWTSTETSEIGEPGQYLFKDSTIKVNEINAWGTISINGNTFNSLRVYQQVTDISMTEVFGMIISRDTTTYIQYSWYTEDIGFIAQVTGLDNEDDPNFSMAQDISFRLDGPIAIETIDVQKDMTYALHQNYPNPFNPQTTIGFNLKDEGPVTLKLYDVRGRFIETIVDKRLDAGFHSVRFAAEHLSAGLYFYELRSAKFVERKRMLLVK